MSLETNHGGKRFQCMQIILFFVKLLETSYPTKQVFFWGVHRHLFQVFISFYNVNKFMQSRNEKNQISTKMKENYLLNSTFIKVIDLIIYSFLCWATARTNYLKSYIACSINKVGTLCKSFKKGRA